MPTQAQVAAKVAKLLTNTDRVDLFVNGYANQVVQTDNGPVDTLAGIEADARQQVDVYLRRLGFEPPVAYSGGLSIQRYSQTVIYNGQVYSPLNIPYTTPNNFDASAWRLIVTDYQAGLSRIGLFVDAAQAGPRLISSKIGLVETIGYRQPGRGVGRYLRDSTLVTASFAAAHPQWTFRAIDETGTATGWRLVPNDDGSVSFGAFGAYCDGSLNFSTGVAGGTDDYNAAWTGCADFVKTTAVASNNPFYRSLIVIQFERGVYRFDHELDLKEGSYTLRGAGTSGAQNGGWGTVLLFTSARGIVNDSYDTSGTNADPAGSSTGSMGSELRDLVLMGSGTPSGANRHGLWERGSPFKTSNVTILYFADDGFRIGIGDGGGDANRGIADNSLHTGLVCSFNGGSGIRAMGGDSNANEIVNPICNSNGRYGYEEKSFLANTYTAGQVDGNGHGAAGRPWDPAGPSAFCSYNNVRYGVVDGQAAAASTTVPGTDSTVWYAFGAGGPNPPVIYAWSSGMTWKEGGPGVFGNPNASCVLLGGYSEGGLGLFQNTGGRSLFIGGIASNSVVGGRGGVTAVDGYLTSYGGILARDQSPDPVYGQSEVAIHGPQAQGQGIRQRNSVVAPEGFNWGWNWTTKTYSLRYGGADPELLVHFGPNTTLNCGRPNPVTSGYSITRLFVGTGDNARQIDYSDAAPTDTAKEHGRGDVVRNLNASLGGPVEFIATVAGAPGTWVPSGIVGGVQAAAQANSTASGTSGIVADFNALLAKLRAAKLIAS